jgi:osmotically-inducible protein OsmY
MRTLSLLNLATAFVAGAAAMYCVDAARSRRQLLSAEHPSDAQLRDRIKARLPELVSQPDAIDIEVESGVVRVSGRVPADERSGLLMQLTDMPGVRMVRNSISAVEAGEEPGILPI